MKRLGILGLMGLCWAVPFGGAAHAAGLVPTGSEARVCPFAGIDLVAPGVDPDFVELQGPTTVVAHAGTQSLTVRAAEEEGGPALVVLDVTVTGPAGVPSSSVPPASGQGSAQVSFDLSTATPGTYKIDFTAALDFGSHPCSSQLPGSPAPVRGPGGQAPLTFTVT